MKKSIRIILQVLSGIAGGILFAVGGALLAVSLANGGNGFADLALGILGMLLGYPIGVFIGTVVSGRLLKLKGSVLFSIIGIIAAFIIFLLLGALGINVNPDLFLSAFFVLFPIGAVVGYNIRSMKK
jgi:MFS family permease